MFQDADGHSDFFYLRKLKRTADELALKIEDTSRFAAVMSRFDIIEMRYVGK